MSDDGSTVVEKKGRGRPKANGTQPVSSFCHDMLWISTP